MSDDIIARIEMPRMATDLVGHAGAVAALTDAWSGGRFAHAWLIAGPAGVGKATLAWRFARFVLAEQRRTDSGDPLGVVADDPAARQVTAGSHPDIRLVRRHYNKQKRKHLCAANLTKSVNFFQVLKEWSLEWYVK